MAQKIGLENVLYNAFNHYTNNFYTCIPCVVITVYNEGKDQRIDVQPSINRMTIEGDVTEHAPILNVPVVFPSSLTSAFTFPINKNDTVLCVFSQRTMDLFKGGSGLPSDPNDFRRFDKRDAIAIPGLFPFQKAINNPKKRTHTHSTLDAVIAHNIGTSTEVEIRLKPDGTAIINSPKDIIANAGRDVIGNATRNANVNAGTSANVTAPICTTTASTSFTVTSPIITLNGNTVVNGNFTMSNAGSYTGTFHGNVAFQGGTLTHDGVNVSSTHTHTILNVQTGSGTLTSQVPH